jgi:multiple sugar transport system permease protein
MARAEARLAWAFALPALTVVFLVAIFPLGWAFWESFHRDDLRLRESTRPFLGLANYQEALHTPRFWEAMLHTMVFVAGTVTLELVLGLVLALALHRAYRGRGLVRMAVLLPWAIPTVVTALLWKFMFEQTGIVNTLLARIGLLDSDRLFIWFTDPTWAWVPIILADAWKMTPFVTLLLLAGLQNIDPNLYEAAQIDGASRWQQFWHITIPLLRPALLVTLIFRTLDSFRVFDLIYVLTEGGPGSSTEPISLYTYKVLTENLRHGYGSALAILIFLVTLVLALCYIKVLGANLTGRVE